MVKKQVYWVVALAGIIWLTHTNYSKKRLPVSLKNETGQEIYAMSWKHRTTQCSGLQCGNHETHYTVTRTELSRLSEYLQYRTIKNINSVASITHSKILIRGNRKYFAVGELITVDIIIYDGWGNKIQTGGDIIRTWVREPSKGASVAGFVKDHGNGSYSAFIRALWEGQPEILVSFAYTKEHVGIFLNYVSKYGLLYYIRGIFVNKGISETTQCSTVPRISKFENVCNFTSENFGMAWYCGHPRKIGCQDWENFSSSKEHQLDKVTLALFEEKIHSVIRIFVHVIKGDTRFDPALSCKNTPASATWNTLTPTGYYFNKKWLLLNCENDFAMSRKVLFNCLRHRPLKFFGDSSTRYWFVYLTEFLGLKFMMGRWDEVKDRAWQQYAYAELTNEDVFIDWAPHELPFYGSGNSSRRNMKAIAARLDEIPSGSKAIVVLHWYLHIARSTYHVFREHVRNALTSVEKLLARAPEATVMIKGPHSVTYKYTHIPYDYVKRFEEQILFEEFYHLHDKVFYLDQWDMTVANENVNVHPDKETNLQMLHTMMSYIC